MMNILFGLIPEAIFFSLFIIFTKNYKNTVKNTIFTSLMIAGYVIFKALFPTCVYCQIIYIFYVPLLMYIMYKEKFHISDIFVMSWASIILLILNIIYLPMLKLFGMDIYIKCYIINRISLLLFLIIFHKKLNPFYKFIISQWNRNREKPNPIKALTVRNVCVISLNLTIYILYVCMIFTSTQNIIR